MSAIAIGDRKVLISKHYDISAVLPGFKTCLNINLAVKQRM